ncbi:MAG: hypothetical protein JWL90_2294 [Chthoniobacteraceae bacterium]|nr:hypothetical protein [Chthoniobacteraceae bacterium]
MKTEQPPFQIKTPCPKQWEEMSGDTKRRFCEQCELHVHNLSAMSSRERRRFASEPGGLACIAYELHPDGSMVTPSRWDLLVQPFRGVRWAAAAVFATLVPFLFLSCATRRSIGRVASSCNATARGDQKNAMVVGVPMSPSTRDK